MIVDLLKERRQFWRDKNFADRQKAGYPTASYAHEEAFGSSLVYYELNYVLYLLGHGDPKIHYNQETQP